MLTNPLIIQELRRDAVADFFQQCQSMGYDPRSDKARSFIHETADNHVPGHYDTLLELAVAPYGQCPKNYFLLTSVESGLLGNEITAADVLQRAVYEFLRSEIEEAIEDYQPEEENDDE